MLIALQLDLAWHDRRENLRRLESALDAADAPAGSLVVLPEMFSSGFSMDPAAVEPSDHPTENVLQEICRQRGVAMVAGLAQPNSAGQPVNEAVCIDADGEVLGRYQKIHRFSFAGEQAVFAAGDMVAIFPWAGLSVAPFICYDLRFPELFRLAAAAGAELFLVIANWPAARQSHWRALLAARAIENQAYVLGVNRAGEDPNSRYAGGSILYGPQGEVLAELDSAPGALRFEIDPAPLRDWRARFGALVDARPLHVEGIAVTRFDSGNGLA